MYEDSGVFSRIEYLTWSVVGVTLNCHKLGDRINVLITLLIIQALFIVGGCGNDSDFSHTPEYTNPTTVSEVTTVTSPTNDTTPQYTFSSTRSGTIIYGGSCSSNTTYATKGNNTINLNPLSEGTYTNCTIRVVDTLGSPTYYPLTITSFIVDLSTATLVEVTAVTVTNDTTPDYTFFSSEAGTITYGGSCSSSTTSANVGNNTITLNTLSEDTYLNCTITVTDSAHNSVTLNASSFVIDPTPPTVSEVTAVTSLTNDTAPNYTFSSDEAVTISYGGKCTSYTTSATSGDNTISLLIPSEGDYNDCTLTVTDLSGNTGNTIRISPFTIKSRIEFSKKLITNDAAGAHDIFPIDLDGDGGTWSRQNGVMMRWCGTKTMATRISLLI